MMVSVRERANSEGRREGNRAGITVAFNGGSVIGLALIGLGLIGISAVYYLLGLNALIDSVLEPR